MNPETIKPIVANRFADYETAHAYYNGTIVPKYGATRLDWGFGRRLAKARAAAAKNGGAK